VLLQQNARIAWICIKSGKLRQTPMKRATNSVLNTLAWPPVVIVLYIAAFTTLLPGRYALLPDWARPPTWIVFGVLVALSIVGNASGRLHRFGLMATVILIAFATVLVAADALSLVWRVAFDAKLRGVPLLATGLGIWIANVVVFALWYWLLDRGGPYKRRVNERAGGDFMFPQDASPDVFPGWTANFVDYLFLAFNTSTAFSPTETFPMTRRAKLLMLVQSLVSLTTIVVVASRAVNILS
jgi:hypothetical protein